MKRETELDALVSLIESGNPEDWAYAFDSMDETRPGFVMDVIRRLPEKYPNQSFREVVKNSKVLELVDEPPARILLGSAIRHVLHLHNQ